MALLSNIKFLQQALGYQFSDPQLLIQALTHRSAASEHNERMEFLGDAVLGNVIAETLFRRFPQADEGQLSRLRAFLVKEKALFERAQFLDIGNYLRLGGGELKSGGFRRASILADAFEAILGAIYLDSDFDRVRQVIISQYQELFDQLTLDMAQKDPKTRLQEWLQARNISTPDYQVVEEKGKDHAKIYWVSCQLTYKDLSSLGKGASRRKAEQDAASKLLEELLNE